MITGGRNMTTKQNVLNDLQRVLQLVDAFEIMDDQAWHQPIAEGKFSKAAIVSHLMYWDQFLIYVAIPDIYRKNEIVFPDHDDKNELASVYTKLVSKEHLIEEFQEVRKTLIGFVDRLPAETLEKEILVNGISTCPRRKQPYTFQYILEEFVMHDDHHVKQLLG
jgi:hypothetical protein